VAIVMPRQFQFDGDSRCNRGTTKRGKLQLDEKRQSRIVLANDSQLAIIPSMKDASKLLLEARSASGLSQRQLAIKARTAQSVVARVELGETSPSWDTLMRLLRASGHILRPELERIPVVDKSILDDVPRILAMTPEQRLEEVASVSRFLAEVKRA
jgi:transcriptional regulator with XRE-family HTH domain